MALFSAFLQLLFSPCYFLGFIRCLCKCPIHFLLCHLLRALPQSSFLLQDVSLSSPSLSRSLFLHTCTWKELGSDAHMQKNLFSGVLFRLQEHWMPKDRVSHLPTPRVRRSGGWEEEAWEVAGLRIKEGLDQERGGVCRIPGLGRRRGFSWTATGALRSRVNKGEAWGT